MMFKRGWGADVRAAAASTREAEGPPTRPPKRLPGLPQSPGSRPCLDVTRAGAVVLEICYAGRREGVLKLFGSAVLL